MIEPFARVHDQGELCTLDVGNVGLRYGVRANIEPLCALLNTAARKYAADMIREAADHLDCVSRDWLRSRADTVERGDI